MHVYIHTYTYIFTAVKRWGEEKPRLIIEKLTPK